MVPRPRREGQSGGMSHGSSGSASRARGGSPGAPRKGYKSGGPPKPPKKGGGFCSLWLLAILAIPATITVASVALAVRA